MDFFKFTSGTSPTLLENGQFINNLENSMWIERYSAPGEFSFTAYMSTDLGNFLPLGTLVSHMDTSEVMIVENQEVQENQEDDPYIIITGRSFVSFLENRIIGVNAARSSNFVSDYTLSADDVWDQIVLMINQHVKSGVADTNDALTDIQATTALGTGGESIARTIEQGTVLERVLELLDVDNMGIKTVRKNFNAGSPSGTEIQIYKGTDKSQSVRFSWLHGDMEAANYLLSLKDFKNAALVKGQYVWTVVETGPTKFERRTMFIDASDIDSHITPAPTGDVSAIVAKMTTRGNEALAKQNTITISQSDISENTQFKYRRDYGLGDLITLESNFNQSFVMKVVEYAEIEDENGESGHPTLALPPS